MSLVASASLAYCLPGVHETFSWFLDFSLRESVHELLLNWCVCGGKEGPGLPTLDPSQVYSEMTS